MKVVEICPGSQKQPLTRFVYWLSMKVEEYIDYTSNIPLESPAGRFWTKVWEALLELSLWFYRREKIT